MVFYALHTGQSPLDVLTLTANNKYLVEMKRLFPSTDSGLSVISGGFSADPATLFTQDQEFTLQEPVLTHTLYQLDREGTNKALKVHTEKGQSRRLQTSS